MASSSSSSAAAPPVVGETRTEGVPRTRETYRWTITNYSALPNANGAETKSDEFTLCGHKWRMGVYPGGNSEDHKEYVSVSFIYKSKVHIINITSFYLVYHNIFSFVWKKNCSEYISIPDSYSTPPVGH